MPCADQHERPRPVRGRSSSGESPDDGPRRLDRASFDARVLDVMARLRAAGHGAWIVGGAPRDALLGAVPHDYDVATTALPDEGMALFAGHAWATGLAHGTITVREAGLVLELTTLRVDGPYLDHRRPASVRFTDSLEADLARRDFTINAIAWSPEAGLIDPFGGREDLAARRLRCVGEPALRFGEDALRILRGLRFIARFALEAEAATAEAMLALAQQLDAVAPERLAAERRALLEAPHPACAWAWPLALWCHAWPALCALPGVTAETWPLLLPPGLRPEARWLALLRPAEREAADALLRDSQLGKPLRRRLLAAHAVLAALAVADDGTAARIALRQLARRHGLEAVELALELLTELRADDPWLGPLDPQRLQRRRAICAAIRTDGDAISLAQLAIDGEALAALAIPPGPRRAALLEQLLDEVIAERVANTRPALEAALRRLSRG